MKLIYSAVYVAVTGFIAYLAGEAMPRRWFKEWKFPYNEFSWEKKGGIYNKFKVKKWKNKIIDMSKIFTGMLPKAVKFGANSKDLNALIKETCVAEFIHRFLCGISGGVYWIWNSSEGLVVWLLCVLGNMPFIMIQRYNRPHLKSLMKRMEKREAAAGCLQT